MISAADFEAVLGLPARTPEAAPGLRLAPVAALWMPSTTAPASMHPKSEVTAHAALVEAAG